LKIHMDRVLAKDRYGRVFGFEPRVVNPPGEVSVYAVLYLRQASIGAELVRLQVVALTLFTGGCAGNITACFHIGVGRTYILILYFMLWSENSLLNWL